MRRVPVSFGRWVTVVFLILASLYLLYYHILPALWATLTRALPWFLPFAIAWFLAAFLDPLVNWLEERARWPRTAAALAAVLVLALGLGLAVVAVTAQLAVELARLAAELPHYAALLKEGLTQLDALYRSWQLPPQVMGAAETGIEAVTEHARGLLIHLVQELVQAASAVPRFFISLIVVVVATFFFSRDKHLIRKGLFSLFPRLADPRWVSMGEELGAGLLGYFKAQTFLITLTALQVLLGLHLLRVKYALSLSLFIAVLDVLPVVGPGTVFLPWAGWEFLTRRYTTGLALLVLYATITIVRQVLEPKVVGRNLGLHPLAALASIYIGVQALGLAGAVLGPLLLVFLKAAYHAGLFARPPQTRDR